ncbi:hypothetical protein GQR58_030193 [Nymphon striatum]|nr:hypothetical protein GQR58_030193 [Nymphon striatum]
MRNLLRLLRFGQVREHCIHRQAVDGQPGHQRIILENHPPLRPRPDDRLATKRHRTTRGLFQPGHQIDQRGFTRSRKPEQHQKLALLHCQIDIVQNRGLARPLTKAFGDVFKFQHSCHIDHRLLVKVNKDWIANIIRSSRKPMMPMVNTATMILARDWLDPF